MNKISIFLFFLVSIFQTHAQKTISLSEIWASATFRPEFVYGIESMNDGLHYSSLSVDEQGSATIDQFSYSTGNKVKTLFDFKNKTINGLPLQPNEYEFSPDERKLLIPTDEESIYRHSTKSAYVVVDLDKNTINYLSTGKQQYAQFSPDGRHIAFVRDNNMFIKNIATGAENTITTDGEFNKIINGAADWVYEEEFSFAQAWQWNVDGNFLSYYRFDETEVKEFNMIMYGSLYPSDYKYKYPKAGETNSTVSIWVYDVKSGKSTKIETGENANQYIPRIKWTNNPNQLSITRLNRLQNHLEFFIADASSGKTKLLFEEKSPTYIDITDHYYFLKDNKSLLWTSELEGFNHLYMIDLATGKKKALTKGNWDVTELCGVDETNQTAFFVAANPTPMEKQIFSVGLKNGKLTRISNQKGSHKPDFSQTFQFYIDQFSSADSPFEFNLYDNKGKLVREIESNKSLKEKLKTYSLQPKEFIKLPVSESLELNAWMIKPPNFDVTKKYPVFMTIYGGPGHNTVLDSYEHSNYLWHQLLAQKGYLVVSVDNRGTGMRGEAFKKSTYKQLGKLEVEDQIAAATYLGTLPYVDKNRIGVQGWSFGGYMSSLCITKGADVFKMAIAVAPVTNWRYYDSIYTERFLQTPQENPSGYDDNSPINHVSRLKGKYLLVHGTADDNVHFQNTVEMVNALVKANKQFDLFFYPDKNHSIAGGISRLHLYTKMTKFIEENL